MALTGTGQRVSNWVPTGSHTRCPKCKSLNVWVAYFVYGDDSKGWEFHCHGCGATGEAEMKGKGREMQVES